MTFSLFMLVCGMDMTVRCFNICRRRYLLDRCESILGHAYNMYVSLSEALDQP